MRLGSKVSYTKSLGPYVTPRLNTFQNLYIESWVQPSRGENQSSAGMLLRGPVRLSIGSPCSATDSLTIIKLKLTPTMFSISKLNWRVVLTFHNSVVGLWNQPTSGRSIVADYEPVALPKWWPDRMAEVGCPATADNAVAAKGASKASTTPGGAAEDQEDGCVYP